LNGDDSQGFFISNLKQEAGDVTSKAAIDFEKIKIGDMLKILPWHSCAAVHQHRVINVIDGENVVDEWEVADGW
jgi:D-serine deaminase-like pyridoxal phosphate-dependent protein